MAREEAAKILEGTDIDCAEGMDCKKCPCDNQPLDDFCEDRLNDAKQLAIEALKQPTVTYCQNCSYLRACNRELKSKISCHEIGLTFCSYGKSL